MAFTFVFALLVSYAATVLAHPAVARSATSLAYQMAQMEELRVLTEEYVRNYPPELYNRMSANISNTEGVAAGCEDVWMIFVRGTFEPAVDKNLGIMVGMPFTDALKTALGGPPKFDSVGLDYSNSVTGYLTGGDTAGGIEMARVITQKAIACPRTKIIASGYSQGAQVTHNALKLVFPTYKRNIIAVILFGDPDKGYSIPGIANNKIYTNCDPFDPICRGIPLPLGTHLTYGSDKTKLAELVQFVKQRV